MPYVSYSKKPYSKTYAKKKGYSKRASSKVTPAVVAKIARQVTRAEKPTKEIRFQTFKAFKTDTLANAFLTVDISNIPSGDAVDQRNGRSIVYLGFRYNIVFDSARVEERFIRLFLVQAKNVNDPPDMTTWSDLLQDADRLNLAPNQGARDFTFPLNTDVWNVYMDKTIKLAGASTDSNVKRISGYCKLNKRLNYDDDGTASSVPVQGGQLWLIAHCAEAYSPTGVNTTETIMDGMVRCFFKDT